jgi:4-hydroxythreonine-4-phosphate dehydrogenase
MTEKDQVFKIGITQGDINGIGYETILKTLIMPRMSEICTPIVYGSSKVASYHRKLLKVGDFSFNMVKTAEQALPKKANMINIVDSEIKVDVGQSTEVAGEMSLLSLEMAMNDLLKNNIQAIVTAPINKKNIQSDTFKFHGHSEYLAQKAGVSDYLMFMICPAVRIGVVTDHIPIRKVSESLTPEKILNKIRLMQKSLVIDFNIRRPKIAVLGLNPHASDEGVIGTEDGDVLFPAIRQAFDEDILAFGPYPADGFFASGQFRKFDGVLAMYHDQGLIPFKLLSQDEGVNYTAGLPFVRTSPAHGTAYDIAGKDLASAESFRSALYLAIDILKNRNQFRELISKNNNPK